MPAKNPIQSIVLTSDTSSVTFFGIDKSYTDLQLVISGTITGNNRTYRMQFNGDTSGPYSYTSLGATSGGTGTYLASNLGYLNFFIMNGGVSTSLYTSHIDIFNYSSTATKKNVLMQNSCADGEICIITGLWSFTTAINSITIFPSANNLAAGTTLDLYGISPVNAKITSASGGTDIFYDSTYAYHVFKGSGTFTPNRALTADILTIAGGAGGGNGYYSGGGGAGGLVYSASQSLTSGTSYTVAVGAGGVSVGTGGDGTPGSNSQFASLTAAVGGGFGAGGAQGAGVTGGSGGNGGGGGADGNGGGAGAGGGGTQGFNGGNSISPGGQNSAGGGGGGTGAIGRNASSNTGGSGGNGSNTYSSWATTTGTGLNGYYGGGGGGGGGNVVGATGGTGGFGGGGSGSGYNNSPAVTSGNTNTGSGGGGRTGGGGAGGAGGSGIVIVRYVR